MNTRRKYVAAVALLGVLAFAFGLASTAAPGSEPIPQKQESFSSLSSSSSVTHFITPPTYDAGWVDITDKCGQQFNLTHNLNTTEVFVDIVGKQALDGEEHQKHLGGTEYTPGWSKKYSYYPVFSDEAYSIVEASDGGYAIAGYAARMHILKTDVIGNVMWTKETGSGYIPAYSIAQTSDNGYVFAGVQEHDFLLAKLDLYGSSQWIKYYGGSGEDWAYSVVETFDGGFAVAGYTNSSGLGGDFLLVKTDSAGNLQWNKTYGGVGVEFAYSMVQAFDGGYALAGYTESFDSGNRDFYLVKTDSVGNMQWNKTYGGSDVEEAYSVVEEGDGGYVIAGRTGSFGAGGHDCWLVKTDSAGNLEWNKTYGGIGWDYARSVIKTDDGGYAIAGVTYSYGVGLSDCWLVNTDSAGNMKWNKTYGGPGRDLAHCLTQTRDGGFALAGSTEWASQSDYFLVKTSVESGLARIGLTNKTITLYRGATDRYWNYVRVRIWAIMEPKWMFGDINQDGIVDVRDLAILSRNYGKTFSLLSMTGMIAVAGMYTVKKRKQNKQPSYISQA